MNIKNILEAYNEYKMNYYINDQELIDNDGDRKIAEKLATYESLEMEGVGKNDNDNT